MPDVNDLSLRDIVRWLATPARCGFYFTLDDLARIGGGFGIAVAPFDRATAIEQLLRGAALDGRLEEMLAALRLEMQQQLDSYRAQHLPALGDWIARGEATLTTWAEIEQTVAAGEGSL